jgi:urate oxidase
MSEIAWNRYGKAAVRLMKVDRSASSDVVSELTIDVRLEGDFEGVYEGDNSACIATDTMKNTVYGLAREAPIGSAEAFASRIGDHFIRRPAVRQVRVSAIEHIWTRIGAHPHAFVRSGGAQWSAAVERTSASTIVRAGIGNLIVLKTADSAFSGFPRDRFTTLPDTDDRLLATAMSAEWTYAPGFADYARRERVKAALLEAFAAHRSQSVQHTLAAMGRAALDAVAGIVDITLTLPNRHHLLVDLKPFGLDNPNEVFVPTDAPYGVIEATIRR